MMEILFRAKHITIDKWYKGYYVKIGRLHYITVIDEGFENGYRLVEVNPDTICQFTGLLDKGGNKIWENDIVQDLINGDVYSCKWNHDNCEYELRNDKESFGLGYAALYHYQVMGTIFDNQELLKGDE